MTGRALADPEANRSVSTVAQFFDDEAWRASDIHKNGHLWPLDEDTDVKLFIDVGFRDHGSFVFVGVL